MGIEREGKKETLKAALMKDSNYFSIVYLREDGREERTDCRVPPPSRLALDLALNSQFRKEHEASLASSIVPFRSSLRSAAAVSHKLRSLPISEIGSAIERRSRGVREGVEKAA